MPSKESVTELLDKIKEGENKLRQVQAQLSVLRKDESSLINQVNEDKRKFMAMANDIGKEVR